jgi:hypothetical protein
MRQPILLLEGRLLRWTPFVFSEGTDTFRPLNPDSKSMRALQAAEKLDSLKGQRFSRAANAAW